VLLGGQAPQVPAARATCPGAQGTSMQAVLALLRRQSGAHSSGTHCVSVFSEAMPGAAGWLPAGQAALVEKQKVLPRPSVKLPTLHCRQDTPSVL
jgi:hypothetical protein